MKNAVILTVVSLGLLLSSCTTYYYGAVKSYDDQIPQNDDGSFTTGKNDVVVTYSFVNFNGDVVFDIFNESDDPVFVNWNKSVLVTEDFAVQNRSTPRHATTYQFSNNNQVVEGADGMYVTKPQNTLFVPPHSHAAHSPIALYDVYNMKLPNSAYDKINVGGTEVRGKVFDPANSPLVFRTYLTIVNDRDKSETVFENLFYISSAFKTVSQDAVLMNFVKNRGDTFYTSEINSAGKTIGWISLIGLIVAGAALAPDSYVENPVYY